MSIDVKKVIDGYPFSDAASISQYLRRIAQRSPILNPLSSATANTTIPSAAEGTPASGTHSSSLSSAGTSSSSTPSNTLVPKRRKRGPRAPSAASSHFISPSLAVSSRVNSGVQETHLQIFQIAGGRPARSLVGRAGWRQAVRPWLPSQIKSSILRYHAC
ncbi:g10660 [Coccomyxa elongata]